MRRSGILAITGMACCLALMALPAGCSSNGSGEEEEMRAESNTYDFEVVSRGAGGHTVVRLLRQGELPVTASVAPTAGANLFSLVCGGVELMKPPESLEGWDGASLGTPVLYPTPCRVPDGRFSFEGRGFDFGLNRGDTHIHGLVRDRAWSWQQPQVTADGVSLRTWIEFMPGDETHDKFGYSHILSLVFTLDSEGLLIEYTVESQDDSRLPYGLGFHPYFGYPGGSDGAWVRADVSGRMAMENLIPTGGMEELAGKYDITRPFAVGRAMLDDVFTGMTPEGEAVIEWRESGVRMRLSASERFGHLIIYAQPENPFFCVENLTSSPDCHNLYDAGHPEASGLEIVEPRGAHTGRVRWKLERM